MKTMTNLLGCVTIAAMLSGCGTMFKQPAPVITYYQLTYPAPQPVTAGIHKTVQVWPMRIVAEYDRDTLVFLNAGHRAGIYPYDLWIAGPADQVTERFTRDLRAMGGFDAVIDSGGIGQKPDFVVYGAIDELAARRADTGTCGAFAFTLTLIKPATAGETQKMLMQKRYERTAPCTRAKPESVAAALSTALQQAAAEAIADIRAAAQ